MRSEFGSGDTHDGRMLPRFCQGLWLRQIQICFAENEVLRLGDVVVRWIEAYLSRRVAIVHFGGELSGSIPNPSGVPKGSVVGPILFLPFVNDLPEALKALTLVFAGDVKMVTPRTQNMHLHGFLIAEWDWSQKRDLPINHAKYNYLTIGREVSLRLSFPPIGLAPPSLYPN